MAQSTLLDLAAGMDVLIYRDNNLLDQGVVRSVSDGGYPIRREITFESQARSPGRRTILCYLHHMGELPHGWRAFPQDPFATDAHPEPPKLGYEIRPVSAPHPIPGLILGQLLGTASPFTPEPVY